jgi:hypothetical protein
MIGKTTVTFKAILVWWRKNGLKLRNGRYRYRADQMKDQLATCKPANKDITQSHPNRTRSGCELPNADDGGETEKRTMGEREMEKGISLPI